MKEPKKITIRPVIQTQNILDQILSDFGPKTERANYEMHEGGLEILNQELMSKVDDIISMAHDLRVCLHKNETENISWSMTELSCMVDNLYAKYLVGPNKS